MQLGKLRYRAIALPEARYVTVARLNQNSSLQCFQQPIRPQKDPSFHASPRVQSKHHDALISCFCDAQIWCSRGRRTVRQMLIPEEMSLQMQYLLRTVTIGQSSYSGKK